MENLDLMRKQALIEVEREKEANWQRCASFVLGLHNSDKICDDWRKLKQEEAMEKLPRKEYQTLDTLDVESLILAKYDRDERIQGGELMSAYDVMLEADYMGRQDEVDEYFESIGE